MNTANLSITEVMNNVESALMSKRVDYMGVEYYVGEIDRGSVALYLNLGQDQADLYVGTDLVYFKGDDDGI